MHYDTNNEPYLSLSFAHSINCSCILGPSPLRNSSTAFFVSSCSLLSCSISSACLYLRHVSSRGGIGSFESFDWWPKVGLLTTGVARAWTDLRGSSSGGDMKGCKIRVRKDGIRVRVSLSYNIMSKCYK